MSRKNYISGNGGSLVILLSEKDDGDFTESIFRTVSEKLPEGDFTIAVYEVSDWDGDFSPWEYRIDENRIFSGNGKNTLENIKSAFAGDVPKFDRVFIAGYSLAGLFALWTLRETDIFDGCACCSGSLWFDGWELYSATHPIKKQGVVYLILG